VQFPIAGSVKTANFARRKKDGLRTLLGFADISFAIFVLRTLLGFADISFAIFVLRTLLASQYLLKLLSYLTFDIRL